MKNLKLFTFAAIILVAVVAACGGGVTGPEPIVIEVTATSVTTSGAQRLATAAPELAEAKPVTEQAEATVVSEQAEATAELTAEAEPTTAGEADLQLDSVSSGLAQLKSYKSKLDMHFVGKDAQGQAVDKAWTIQEEFILDPPAQHLTWTGSESTGNQPATVTTWETISIGQVQYMISRDANGEETCIQMTSSEATSPEQTLTPDMWGSISDARYVGTDTVNGVRTKHYTWKEGALAVWGFAQGKADTWVAVDGGYVVKQAIEVTGKGIFLAGSDEEGTTTWQWNVTDANRSFQIEPPAGCESAATSIPIMADAVDKTMIGDMVTYTSPSAFADVVSFYKTEMPKAGWQASGTPTETEGFTSLEFTREGSTASLIFSWDASAQTTTVVVNVTKQ